MKINYFYLLLASFVFTACSQSHRDQTAAGNSQPGSYNGSSKENAAAPPEPEAKLVKTADMRFKVQDVQKSTTSISGLANSMNGMVMDQNLESTIENTETTPISNDSMVVISSYFTQSNMVVRVPSERLEEFLNAAGKLAVFINSRNMHIDDKSLDYLSAKMKNANRKQFVKEQQKNAQEETADAEDVLNVKDELVNDHIGNMKIDDAVKYSTVGLKLYQNSLIRKEVIANNTLSNYQLPFFTRVANSFGYGWILFIDFLVALTHIWIFMVLAAVIWFGIRYRRRKFKAASHLKN
jgi:Domain of unknown function (DUF4349)